MTKSPLDQGIDQSLKTQSICRQSDIYKTKNSILMVLEKISVFFILVPKKVIKSVIFKSIIQMYHSLADFLPDFGNFWLYAPICSSLEPSTSLHAQGANKSMLN